jgi:trimeric autotransporter adhesin
MIMEMCKNLFFKFSILIFALSFSLPLLAQEVTQENGGNMKARADLELLKVKDITTGKIPTNAYWDALMKTKQSKEFYNNTHLRTGALTWVERGPTADAVGPSNGNTRANNAVSSGRIRAVQVDGSDATGKTVWVAGVDGGLWKTTDVTVAPANWTVVNDYLSNLAVTDICQNPANKDILYFCTGEAYGNSDAVAGVGVFKSIDHGVTWSQLSSTATFTFNTRIVCDYLGNVYLATRGSGLQRSTDGGLTWTNITPTGMSTNICDLEISSQTAAGRLHVVGGIFSAQSYRYTDAPTTVASAGWTAPTTAFPSYNNRAEIACLGNTLYACPADASYQVPTVYKSINGGATWTATTTQPTSGWASGQGWYALAIGIDPSNANNCIVGGLDNYKTTDGGTTWAKISNWVGTTGQYAHADQQDICWYDNGNKLLFANDGGLYFSADKGTTIRDRNVGLRIKQFFSVASHPTTTNYFIAGAQDNGNHQFTNPGLSTTVEVMGGDGAFVAIDQDQPQYQFIAYVYNQYRRSTDGGATWSQVNLSSSSASGLFINPFDYDNINNRLYASGTAGSYLYWSNPQTGSTNVNIAIADFNGAKVSTAKVSPFTSNRVYFGTTGGRIVRVNDATLASPVSVNLTGVGMPAGFVSSINVGTNDNFLIATFSNYNVNNVWVSTDAGATWTAVDGNLPNMPVRWAMFEPGDNTRAIIATETGVWETSVFSGATTSWIPSLNFPSVRTDMLAYRSGDRTLAAATHGRGLFTTIIPTTAAVCNAPATASSSSVTSNSATVSWSAVTGAVSYNVDYKLASATTWTVLAANTTALSANITGLTPASNYSFRVNTNCSGSTSTYTGQSFITLAAPTCNAPASVTSSAISASGATISWPAVSGAVNYSVDYKLATATTWLIQTAGTTSLSTTITGLTASSSYNVRVRTNCSGNSSAYTQANFTTIAATSACPGTLDVSTNGVYTGSATIPFNTDVKGTISASGDIDFYKFVITTGGTATITLGTLPFDYDVDLISSNGTTILQSSALGGTSSETITRTYTAGTYYIKVFGYAGANSATSCYTLKVQLGTASLQEPLIPMNDVKTLVKFYPNPAKNELNLSTTERLDEKSMVQISDISGKILISEPFISNPQSFDVSELKPGLYILNVITANKKASYKFIKE